MVKKVLSSILFVFLSAISQTLLAQTVKELNQPENDSVHHVKDTSKEILEYLNFAYEAKGFIQAYHLAERLGFKASSETILNIVIQQIIENIKKEIPDLSTLKAIREFFESLDPQIKSKILSEDLIDEIQKAFVLVSACIEEKENELKKESKNIEQEIKELFKELMELSPEDVAKALSDQIQLRDRLKALHDKMKSQQIIKQDMKPRNGRRDLKGKIYGLEPIR